jgi:hypothetical protein
MSNQVETLEVEPVSVPEAEIIMLHQPHRDLAASIAYNTMQNMVARRMATSRRQASPRSGDDYPQDWYCTD